MVGRRGLLLGAAGLAAAGCATPNSNYPRSASGTPGTTPREAGSTAPMTASRVLLAYFSRPGENYFYGGRRDLEVGNTEVLAGMIGELIDCDTYKIEAGDPYPDGYDATVARNVDEQDADARPAIVDPLDSIGPYDTVLLGSPIWNVRPPMIMSTFAEAFDFTGKSVYPFVTYAVSGLGNTERVYTTACAGGRVAAGLAIQGEDVGQRRGDVDRWLRAAGLLHD